jgi:hypothetical protein
MSMRYVQALLYRAASIQSAIEREHTAKRPDWRRLAHLKKLRLVLKDRLRRLADGVAAQPAPQPVRVRV